MKRKKNLCKSSSKIRMLPPTNWSCLWDLKCSTVAKNPPDNAGDTGDMGSIPGSARSPGVGNGNPLQYSCLENFLDR